MTTATKRSAAKKSTAPAAVQDDLALEDLQATEEQTTKPAASKPEPAQEQEENNLLIMTGWFRDDFRVRTTQDGRQIATCNGQFKSRDGQYSPDMSFCFSNCSSGDHYTTFMSLHAEGHRLLRVEAWCRPWHGNDGRRNATWMVKSIKPMGDPSKAKPKSDKPASKAYGSDFDPELDDF